MRFLITGASGLLGGTLAAHLAGLGHGVVAMTGRRPPLLPSGPSARAWAGEAPRPGEVLALSADLRRDRPGPDDARLAAGLDAVVHCAALTAFGADLAQQRAVNVEGTARVLALAARAGPRPLPLLHVSTAYVCGECRGPVPEAPVPPSARFVNGYERSKAEAEVLVLAAGRAGLPVAVARPSVVVGAWADGAIARFGDLYALVRLVTEGRIRTLPAAPGASLDLVPIDHVVHGLAVLAEHLCAGHGGAARGRVFHLVSGAPVPVARLRALALDYPQFRAPRLVPPSRFDPAALDAAEAWWHARVAAPYASYLRRAPRFADANLRALGARPCPPVDCAFLHRLLDRCIAEGFLRPGSEGKEALPSRGSGQGTRA